MNIEITPMQLFIYLQMVIRYAKKDLNCELREAEKISKEISKVHWDEDAMLCIIEKPF